MPSRVRVAVFRPADDRMAAAVELLESLGATPVRDPMLAIQPTGGVPEGADYTVLTSKTGVELLKVGGWHPGETVLCCIGESTAEAAREAGWTVDRVPAEFSSQGLVDALAAEVEGETVEVARSDHGSDVLLEGLREAGADVTETVLYELVRPPMAGDSAEMAALGKLEAALFTSSLTVEHFLDAAEERGVREDAVAGLNDAVVGVIGDPTRETAEAHDIEVDVVPPNADFEELATIAVEEAAPTHRD
jgi:uroporphyrinogen-III synthase